MYQVISSEFAEYKMGDFINNGQFSTVKSALELRSGKRVAVKIVDKRNLSKLQIERLYIEMHILKQISHSHIIKLFDIIQTDSHVYLITELMGQDLFEYLRMVGRVDEDRCKKIISQLLDAISYLHENNIVHRDIKPENILLNLGDENSIVLADFGFAKYSNPDEEIETPCGTLQYIAPEIANNEKYKKSIDLWGVGVTLYLLLSGQPPFFSSDTNKLREKVLKGRVTFSPKRWNNISEDAKDFIKILLSKDPSKRPSAKEALKNKWFSKSSSPVLNHHHISIQRSQPKSIPISNIEMDTNDDLFSPPNKQRMIDVFSPENTPPQISQGTSGLLVKKVLDITFSFQQPEDFRNGAVDDSNNQIELGSVNNSSLFKKRTKK